MGIKMNTTEVRRKIDKAIDEFPDMIGKATREHTKYVFEITQVLVPKRLPALVLTGKIVKNPAPKDRYSFSIWYGDQGEIDYAAAVHEILKAKHASPTQAKYVEQPLIESVPAAQRNISTAAQKAVKVVFK